VGWPGCQAMRAKVIACRSIERRSRPRFQSTRRSVTTKWQGSSRKVGATHTATAVSSRYSEMDATWVAPGSSTMVSRPAKMPAITEMTATSAGIQRHRAPRDTPRCGLPSQSTRSDGRSRKARSTGSISLRSLSPNIEPCSSPSTWVPRDG